MQITLDWASFDVPSLPFAPEAALMRARRIVSSKPFGRFRLNGTQ